MHPVTGRIEYQCLSCDEKGSVDIEDCNEPDISASERGMGQEYLYRYIFNSRCAKCEKELKVEVIISEYPTGALGIVADRSEGARVEFVGEINDDEDELRWLSELSNQSEVLHQNLESAKSLLAFPLLDDKQLDQDRAIMLWGFIVASIEGYLKYTLIYEVTHSDNYLRAFVESSRHFKNKKISLSRIYNEQENLKETARKYLEYFIFHRIEGNGRDKDSVREMYKDTLGIQLGNVEWLKDAIKTRHICVHSAGRDAEGKPISITQNEIIELIDNARNLESLVKGTIEANSLKAIFE